MFQMAYDMSVASQVKTTIEAEIVDPNADLFALGLSHATGVGADLDYVEAHKWFNIAAMRGDCEAKQRRQELTAMMTQTQLAAAQRAAREWLQRTAN
jgi:TPR repeat protein